MSLKEMFFMLLEKITSKLVFPGKTSEIIIDLKIIEEGQTKIEKSWSWKKMKHEKFAITKEGSKVNIQKIG